MSNRMPDRISISGLVGYARQGTRGEYDKNSPDYAVICAEPFGKGFFTGQKIVFLDPMTGLKQAGPVEVVTYDIFTNRLKLNYTVSFDDNTAIYEAGAQSEEAPPRI